MVSYPLSPSASSSLSEPVKVSWSGNFPGFKKKKKNQKFMSVYQTKLWYLDIFLYIYCITVLKKAGSKTAYHFGNI